MFKENLCTMRPKLNSMTGRLLCHEHKPSESDSLGFLFGLYLMRFIIKMVIPRIFSGK